MNYSEFCQADNLLTRAGVEVYQAHESLRYNDTTAALSKLSVACEAISKSILLINNGTDPLAENLRGKSFAEIIKALPISDQARQVVIAAATIGGR